MSHRECYDGDNGVLVRRKMKVILISRRSKKGKWCYWVSKLGLWIIKEMVAYKNILGGCFYLRFFVLIFLFVIKVARKVI